MDPKAVEWSPTGQVSTRKSHDVPESQMTLLAADFVPSSSTTSHELTSQTADFVPSKSKSNDFQLTPGVAEFVPPPTNSSRTTELTRDAVEFVPEYIHNNTELAPQAAEFLSTTSCHTTAVTTRQGPSSIPLCRFFARGACRNALSCPFRHDAAAAAAVLDDDVNVANKAAEDETDAIKSPTFETLGEGIQCEFGPGAAVVNLVLPTAPEATPPSTTVMITGLPKTDIEEKDFRAKMAVFGKVERMTLETDRTYPQWWFVSAKFEEAKAAASACSKLHGSPVHAWNEMAGIRNGQIYARKEHQDVVSVVLKDSPAATSSGVSVKVTWYAPSRCAWIYYHTEKAARDAAKFCNGQKFFGRTLTTTFKVQQRWVTTYTRPKIISDYFVWVGNLGEFSPDDKLKWFFEKRAKTKVKSITVGKLSYLESQASAILQKKLSERGGPLLSFELADNPAGRPSDDLKRKALARFATVNGAGKACEYFRREPAVAQLGGGKIFVQRVFSVKYSLPTSVLDAIKNGIFSTLSSLQGVRYRLYEHGLFCTMSVTADTQAQLDSVKKELDRIVEGNVLRDPAQGDGALWNRYVNRFQFALPVLGLPADSAVWCDRRRQQVRVFGSQRGREKACEMVLVHCLEALKETHAVPVAEHEFQFILMNGRPVIDSITVATKVHKVSSDIKNKALLVEGDHLDSRRVKAYVAKIVAGLGADDALSPDTLCPVCFCAPEGKLVKVDCGHVYCEDCFDAWVGSGSIREFPLVCLEEKCDKPLDFGDLKSNLSTKSFTDLLRLSFDAHIRAHPDKLQFCLSPTCPGVYETSKDSRKSSCSTCSLEICLDCKASHTDLSCDDFRLVNQPPEVLRMRVIDEVLTLRCPRCQQAFCDFDGCLAIRCSVCPCSFCGWCLQDCGTDAHGHVRHCTKSKNPGTFYGSFEEFQLAQNERRAVQLSVFLNKLSLSQKEATLETLSQELLDLNIRV